MGAFWSCVITAILFGIVGALSWLFIIHPGTRIWFGVAAFALVAVVVHDKVLGG